jgi:glyceraldehyde 3-phosphate dehydrogenase
MTTIHSYTNDQQLARFASTKTFGAHAPACVEHDSLPRPALPRPVALVLPELKGSSTESVCAVADAERVARRRCDRSSTNRRQRRRGQQGVKDAANEELEGILAFSEEPLVSSDFKQNSNSSIVDAEYTKVIGGNLIKILPGMTTSGATPAGYVTS